MAKNSVAVTLLLKHGSNVNLKNIAGDTPAEMAIKFNAKWIHSQFVQHAAQSSSSQPLCRIQLSPSKVLTIPSWRHPQLRWYIMAATPFVFFFLFGQVFESDFLYLTKSLMFIALCSFLYLLANFMFDNRNLNVLAISLYLSTKFWLYWTFFFYFLDGECANNLPVLILTVFVVYSPLTLMAFIVASSWLMYNFYKAYSMDPGFVENSRDEQFQVKLSIFVSLYLDLPFLSRL